MSYQVLARKWRPNSFAELVGQEHVVTAISNALDNDRLHHAYLFSGTRGVGKTTIARIFSKSLNCEQGLSATPCGKCGTCQEIEQGNFVDLLEIDAASRTKVEDTRELLDNVQYRPTRGRYKVYLIDEVHMLSKHSFNALLKTLEEPPPHVKFLLATTDPQKLPVTILSRCLQFNLKALSRTQIATQLDYIFTQEQIESDVQANAQLARAAQGSMRDALSLSDQAIAQGNGKISLQIVTDMLGLMDKNQVLKLLSAILQKDSSEALEQIEHMSTQAPDFAQVLAELMSLLHQVALSQFVPDACKLETISARAIFSLAKSMAPEQVQLLYQIALQGKKDMPFAVDGRTGLEMTVLRMLAFSPVSVEVDIDDVINHVPVVTNLPVKPKGALPVEPSESAQSSEPEALTNNSPELSSGPVEPDLAPQAQAAVPRKQSEPTALDEQQLATDLFAQQQDIIQQAQDLHPSSPDMFDESLAQPQHALSQEPEAELTPETSESIKPVGLSTTENLLALKRKLIKQQTEQEEQASQVKKSEGGTKAPWSPPKRGASQDLNPSTAELPENSTNIGETITTVQPNTSVELENTPPPWHDTQSVVAEIQSESTEVLEPITADAAEITTPNSLPCETKNPDESLSPVEADIVIAQPTLSFDPNAHLDDVSDYEVDIEVSAFLSDGQKLIAAEQVDSWSKLIEQMQITALTKQLALHSSYHFDDGNVTLVLHADKEHLNTESAREQLQQALTEVLQQEISLQVELDAPKNTPFGIQQSINGVRQSHAQHVVETDPDINLLRDMFSANVIENSVKPR